MAMFRTFKNQSQSFTIFGIMYEYKNAEMV